MEKRYKRSGVWRSFLADGTARDRRKGEEKGEEGILVGPIDSRKLGVGPLGGGGRGKNACIKEAASPGKRRKRKRCGVVGHFSNDARNFVPRDNRPRPPRGEGRNEWARGKRRTARREGNGESRRNGTGLSEIYVKVSRFSETHCRFLICMRTIRLVPWRPWVFEQYV